MGEAIVVSYRRLRDSFWQDGWQRGSRRNAWRAMVADHARARARDEAEAAVPAVNVSRRTRQSVGVDS